MRGTDGRSVRAGQPSGQPDIGLRIYIIADSAGSGSGLLLERRGQLKADLEADIERVLTCYLTVAVAGASPKPERPSHIVARFLMDEGFRVIPVTPNAGEVLGEKAYPDLASIPEPVEVVDIFRKPEEVLPVVEEAIRIGAKAVWLQEGVVNDAAADMARKAGLTVVMDRCMRKEMLKRRDRVE